MKTQFTIVQEFYKGILEKRAADAALTPEYDLNSQEIALRDVESNKDLQKKDLKALLPSSVKTESKDDTAALNKALPKATDKEDTMTSNPLVKVAMNRAFFHGLRQVDFLKTASADYMKIVYTSFNDELSKIAAPGPMFSMKGVGNMLGSAGKKVSKPPPIPAAAMKPKPWGPGTVIEGQSIANNATVTSPNQGFR